MFSRERSRPPCARLPARGGIRPAEGHRPGSWQSWPVVALWAGLWWPVGESPGPRVRTDVVGRAYRRQGVCSAGLLRGCVSVRLAPTLQSTPPPVRCVRHTCRLEGGASAGARVGPTSLCCGGRGGGCQAGAPIGPLAAQVLSLYLRPPQVVVAGGAGPRGLQRIPGTGPLCTRRLGQEEMKSRL